MSSDLSIKVLNEYVNKVLLIKLRNIQTIRGILKSFDKHMNLVLEKSEDVLSEGQSKSLGSIILRGDNILTISLLSTQSSE